MKKSSRMLACLMALSLMATSCSLLSKGGKLSHKKGNQLTLAEEPIVYVPEKSAEFPGGMAALVEYLAKNTRYPISAEKRGIQGRVIVQFVIERDGTIKESRILRGVESSLDQEALRLIKSMPKWTPAIDKGKKVRQSYTLPVVFRLK